MYMTRQLSFAGVTFDIKELPLSLDFIEMYNDSVKLVSGMCVNRDGLNSFLLSISSLLAMLSTCGLLLYFVKLLWTLNYFVVVVVVVITIFQNSQGNHVTVFSCELCFMCTVDLLLLTIPRTCMCIHFLFVFPILILWQSTVQLGDFVVSVFLICLLAMLLRLRYGSFHLQDVATKHSKFAFLYSGLRPEKNLSKQQN